MAVKKCLIMLATVLLLAPIMGNAAERQRLPEPMGPVLASTAAPSAACFRETRWQMSPEQVMAAEQGIGFEQNGAYLLSTASVKAYGGFDAKLAYMFIGDRLAAGVADFSDLPETYAEIDQMFKALFDEIMAMYGEESIGHDDLLFDERTYATSQDAIEAKEISHMVNFLVGGTQIELIFHMRGAQRQLTVQYFDTSSFPM